MMDQKQLTDELTLIRGPVPLEHNRPLTAQDGHLGRVSAHQDRQAGFLRKALYVIVAAVLSGSGGAAVAVRSHLIEQGRTLERSEQKDRQIRRLERRVHCLEGDARSCSNLDSDHQDVITR